jgi:beta-phosphoglucomutase
MEKHTNIRAVIFDMDGVLVDSEPLINAAAIVMFKEKGLIVQPEDFLPFVGAGEDRYIGGAAEYYGFPLDVPAAKKRTYEIYLDLVPSKLEAFPGALELVHNCRKAGLSVAVASSADLIKVRANLETIGLPIPFWAALVTGEDVKNKKPAPDLFLAAAGKLGVNPPECVVVEDAVNGIQAAKAAGMRCVAVATTFPPDRLQAADVVRATIADVQLSDLAPPLGKSLSGEQWKQDL